MIALTDYADCQFCGSIAPHVIERLYDRRQVPVCAACLRLVKLEKAPFVEVTK